MQECPACTGGCESGNRGLAAEESGHSVIGPRREPEMSDISRYKLLSRVEENTYHMPIACQVHVHCLLSIHARKRCMTLKRPFETSKSDVCVVVTQASYTLEEMYNT